MDFIESAKILVPALCGLNLSVFCDDDKTQPLRLFEKQYAFSAKLQPSFTEKGLLSLFEKKGAENILVIRDALDIFAVMIKINKRWILLGPFCTANWNESNAISLLAKNGLGNAELLPYKSYRCGLPVMSEEYIIKIAALLITNTVGNPPRELEIINMAALKLDDLPPQISEAYNDFSQVNRRYAWENDLMDAVRQGQTARALNLLEGNKGLWTGIRFLTDSITDQIAGSCTLRALVRHAAQQAGLTPVFIDALSQEYAQKMHRHTTDAQQLNDLLHQYIAAFCRAVRDNKKKDYSIHVKRSVQYIELHLSQPISMDTLCELNGITRQRLGALFKKEIGKTVKQYIMQRRCECAAGLLQDSRLQVQEIGRYVGYEDGVYFARVFKSVMGQSPQEFRNQKKYF